MVVLLPLRMVNRYGFFSSMIDFQIFAIGVVALIMMIKIVICGLRVKVIY